MAIERSLSHFKKLPVVTLMLSVLSLILSFNANLALSGTWFGKIRVVDLEPYGGLLLHHIADLELWRLLVSNLIHVKQVHMLYNVFSLILLGVYLEKRMKSFPFFCVWIITGVLGNIAGSFTVPAPWGIGTGGSAANFGLMGCGLYFYLSDKLRIKGFLACLMFALVPALILDIIYADYHAPKVGHVVPLILGYLYGVFVYRVRTIRLTGNKA